MNKLPVEDLWKTLASIVRAILYPSVRLTFYSQFKNLFDTSIGQLQRLCRVAPPVAASGFTTSRWWPGPAALGNWKNGVVISVADGRPPPLPGE